MKSHPVAFHISLLTLLHLVVDGLCACGIMMMACNTITDVEGYGIIVLYDVLAFGTQPLTGHWLDTGMSGQYMLKLAVALLIAGAVVSMFPFYLSYLVAIAGNILLGMGNSLFHVYGGKYVAVATRNDIRALGIFVSTGAVGLAIGLGFHGQILLAVFILALLTLSALHLHHSATVLNSSLIPQHSTLINGQCSMFNGQWPLVYLLCLMLVVSGRAFIGESVPSLSFVTHQLINLSTRQLVNLSMVAVSVIVMLGKAGGGFLSKKWGVRNVFNISMLLSALAFLACPWHDGFVLATLLLVNISMPCTLYLAIKAVPGREGLAFGLLAMALLPGFLLGTLAKDNATIQLLLVPLMATILLESLLLLCIRERRWQVLALSVVLNIFTNVPLNAFVMTYSVTSPLHLFGLECVVVVVESIGYWLLLHEWSRAFKYSILCNSFSAIVGFLCQYALTYCVGGFQ